MLEVIGAGFGRTGTTSLKAALERLGLEPCHTMLGLFSDADQIPAWRRAARGEPVDWSAVYAGYRASVDWPGAAFWRQLTTAFPKAKVILTLRDPEQWYASAYESIYSAAREPLPESGVDPVFADVWRMSNEVVWDGVFQGRFEDREYALRTFEAHRRAVVEEVPADRLLVFQVRQGWEPLCDFLGVPVPDEPFPHTNDRAEFTERIRERRAGS